MQSFESLNDYLSKHVSNNAASNEVAEVILAITSATTEISALVRRGALAGAMGATRGDNSDGDVQKELDIVANDIIVDALRDAPVAWIASEELENALAISPGAPVIVAIDPLDGSSNIDTNTSVGTIFSLLPASASTGPTDASVVLQKGSRQLAAAYVI